MNKAYVFSRAKNSVYDTDESQITTTTVKFHWKPLTIVSLQHHDYKTLAFRLSNLRQPQTGKVKKSNCVITTEQLEKKLLKAIKNGKIRNHGSNVVSVYWIIDTFLKQEAISEKSEWIIISPSVDSRGTLSINHLMEGESADEQRRKHIQLQERLEDKIEREVRERLEKSLFEKLKSKIKGEKNG